MLLSKPKQASSKMSAIRHRGMHGALRYMEENGCATTTELAIHLNQSPASGRKIIRDFLLHKLIVADHEENPRGSGRSTVSYRLTVGALQTAEDLFPTEWVGLLDSALVDDDDDDDDDNFRTRKSKHEPEIKIHRDPLVAFIHGFGRAPSLNFMDSIQGVDHAKSQATDGTY